MISALCFWNSVAVVKPIGTSLAAAKTDVELMRCEVFGLQLGEARIVVDTRTLSEDFVCLSVGYTLDRDQRFLGRKGHRFDGVEASTLKLLHINSADAMLLQNLGEKKS